MRRRTGEEAAARPRRVRVEPGSVVRAVGGRSLLRPLRWRSRSWAVRWGGLEVWPRMFPARLVVRIAGPGWAARPGSGRLLVGHRWPFTLVRVERTAAVAVADSAADASAPWPRERLRAARWALDRRQPLPDRSAKPPSSRDPSWLSASSTVRPAEFAIVATPDGRTTGSDSSTSVAASGKESVARTSPDLCATSPMPAGDSTSTTSPTSAAKSALCCRISWWTPADAGEVIGPGTPSAGRPSCSVHEIVLTAPLRSAASTTTDPAARPAMIRLRARKRVLLGLTPGGSSLTTTPSSAMRSSSARWPDG